MHFNWLKAKNTENKSLDQDHIAHSEKARFWEFQIVPPYSKDWFLPGVKINWFVNVLLSTFLYKSSLFGDYSLITDLNNPKIAMKLQKSHFSLFLYVFPKIFVRFYWWLE